VRFLEPGQVDCYAEFFDLVLERMQVFGGDPGGLMVEVLSTCPRPLAEALARHRLGRYRVTQKAAPANVHDVYRSERARPEDWIMVGNHDTPPLRAVIERWERAGRSVPRAEYLASRLATAPQERAEFLDRLSRDPAALATAMFADLFCGPARHVLIFWVDLFGLREIYNRPGVVDGANWSLRVPADFERAYRDACAHRQAPDLGQALGWALHARKLDRDPEGQALRAALLPPEDDAD
jgi:4-alpha-glucanotransferase